jgi:cell division protein ZapB
MSNPADNSLLELKDLETKLDEFIGHYNSVIDENADLKSRQEALVQERAVLLEKTNLAKTRVEAMISRLKAMEQGS